MVKVTYTLDDETVTRLRRLAKLLGKPQSQIVRESVKAYEARTDKLSDEERKRMLAVIDRMMKEPPTRPQSEVDAELRELRWTRSHGWRDRQRRS